jgi:anti-sigma factor RsiW
MNCDDVRARLERALPREPRDAALASHLAQCPDCGAHAAALSLVDARLGAMHARIDVPSDFDVRLRARLARERERSHVDREAVERELDGWRARLRRESWLDGTAVIGAGVSLGLAAWHFAPDFAHLYASATSSAGVLVTGAVAAAITLAAGWLAVGRVTRGVH